MAFRAPIRWMDGQEERRAYGPRRSEKRRAEEDMEVMREASSRHEDVLARRQAVTAEARRLQQLLLAARGCGTYCRSTISGIKKAQKALP